MRRLLALAALAAAGSLALAGVSSGKVVLKCIPNVRPGTELVSGRVVRIYCGIGKMTLHRKGVTYTFTNGLCLRLPNVYIIGVGKFTRIQPGKGGPLYKGVVATAPAGKDGTYKDGLVQYQLPGKPEVDVQGTIVLTKGRSHGTIDGRVQTGSKTLGDRVTGTFSCK